MRRSALFGPASGQDPVFAGRSSEPRRPELPQRKRPMEALSGERRSRDVGGAADFRNPDLEKWAQPLGVGSLESGNFGLRQASSEEVTQAQTAPLIVSPGTKGYAAAVIAKWGVQAKKKPRLWNSGPLNLCGLHLCEPTVQLCWLSRKILAQSEHRVFHARHPLFSDTFLFSNNRKHINCW